MSNSPKVERKLAAIMFTDIAGYTEQMSADENKAYAQIKKKREILLPLVEKYEGKLIKEIGDGTLTRYFNVNNAVECASIFQAKTYSDLNVRAGIHTGKVIIDNEDVFGDVVNVASRIESIAVPGSVFISKETIEKLELSNKLNFISLGMQSFKGVGRLIDVYAINDDKLVVPNPQDYKENKIEIHRDNETPSIAIIPFKNKGAEEDVFYAYGISSDLISDCSSAGAVRVASISDIEKLDYTNLNNFELSKKLFVRYVSHGVLWKMGDLFQLSIEVFDTKDKKVVWSDRWQEKWDNLTIIKNKLSDGLLKILNTKIKFDKQFDTKNTKAYEYYLEAQYLFENRKSKNHIEKSFNLVLKALDLDKDCLPARLLLIMIYANRNEYDLQKETALKLLEDANRLNNKKYIAKAYSRMSACNPGKLDIQKEYALKALNIFEKIDDYKGISNIYCQLAIYEQNYNKRTKYIEKAIEYYSTLEDKMNLASTLELYSYIVWGYGDLDRVERLYEQIYEYNKFLKSTTIESTYYQNTGELYYFKGAYQQAILSFQKSLTIYKSLDDMLGKMKAYQYLGASHYGLKKYNEALQYINSSVEIFDNENFENSPFSRKKSDCFLMINLCLKALNRKIDLNHIKNELSDISCTYENNYFMYKLFTDKEFLKTSHDLLDNQLQNTDIKIKNKFYNYPIPKQIIEEYNKVFK